MSSSLQPYAIQPAALCNPACSPMQSRLQPYLLQVLAELEALKLDSSTLVVSTAPYHATLPSGH